MKATHHVVGLLVYSYATGEMGEGSEKYHLPPHDGFTSRLQKIGFYKWDIFFLHGTLKNQSGYAAQSLTGTPHHTYRTKRTWL